MEHALGYVKRGLITGWAVRPRLPLAAVDFCVSLPFKLISGAPSTREGGRREEGTGHGHNPDTLPNRPGCWVTEMKQCVGERSALQKNTDFYPNPLRSYPEASVGEEDVITQLSQGSQN